MKRGVWRVQCEVWGVKSAVWSVGREECSVKCGVWSVECGVWRKQWEVGSVKCGLWSVGLWSVKCEVWSAKCEVRSGASNVTCETGHHFRRKHARTGLAGARRMQVLQMRKVLYVYICIYIYLYIIYIYIPKATSAPPRAGTTGIISLSLIIYLFIQSHLYHLRWHAPSTVLQAGTRKFKSSCFVDTSQCIAQTAQRVRKEGKERKPKLKKGVSENVVYPFLPNGFADHYPY